MCIRDRAGRAASLRAAGQVSGALKAADELIARWPERPAAYLQRGSTLDQMGDVPAARAAFQRASQLAPTDLRGPLFEGRMLARLKRFGEAQTVLQDALELPGVSPPLTYFKNLLAVQSAAQASQTVIQATLERARQLHGDEVDSFFK